MSREAAGLQVEMETRTCRQVGGDGETDSKTDKNSPTVIKQTEINLDERDSDNQRQS